jgi:hypothetical protein
MRDRVIINNGESSKHRLNLTMSKGAVRKGKRLARLERRSFSNMLEVLIERAGQATNLPPAAEAEGCQCTK